MTKALIKKQLLEVFSWIFQNSKNGKRRTGKGLLAYGLLYLFVFGMLGFVFYEVADVLCTPLVLLKLEWLYFALMGLMGTLFGMLGSAFNTYTSLYQAKDNDMLLAMPISVRKILFARLTGVYAVGLLYEMVVLLPTVIVYFLRMDVSIRGGIFTVLIPFILSFFVLAFSCVVGWIVGILSNRLKNQKIVTVILVLGFLGCYYYVFSQASFLLEKFLENPIRVIRIVKTVFYPLYHMGLAAGGSVSSMLIFTAIMLGCFGVVYVVLSRSFLKMATTNRGSGRREYVEKKHKLSSPEHALLGKEFRRFLSSTNYMLNCGLGIVFMIIAAVAVVVKRDLIVAITRGILGENEEIIWLAATACICMLSTMNDMSAPSVSLEGKYIWLTQIMPVSGWQVLKAKMKMHLILTWIPAMILTVCVEWVLRPDGVFVVLMPIAVVLFVGCTAALGLVVNLKFPNLSWTNEVVPIKQSIGVMIAMLGGWGIVLALGFIYYLLMKWVMPDVYLVVVMIVLLVVDFIMIQWLRKRGARIFETL